MFKVSTRLIFLTQPGNVSQIGNPLLSFHPFTNVLEWREITDTLIKANQSPGCCYELLKLSAQEFFKTTIDLVEAC